MEIYLIRHTTPNVERGICYGHSDLELANSFPEELDFLKKNLPEQFDAIYTSPLQRCKSLAEKFTTNSFYTDDRLKEMNFGDWEMRKWDEIEAKLLNEWMTDFVNHKVPSGESFIELKNRVDEFITELLQKSYEQVAIITHGGVVRYLVSNILEMPLKNTFKIPSNYASITRININADNCLNSLKFLNKTCSEVK